MSEAPTRSKSVFIHGLGAVSPAGWGVQALADAVAAGEPMGRHQLSRPGWNGRTLEVRQVPLPSPRPAFVAHPRLRRTSAISQYAVAAALEALGDDAAKVAGGELDLGVILCVMSGCVNYSRRFYDETLRDPTTASPLVFPETVFNAPGSHLAALLGSSGINYTLVGDPGTFLQGIALGADWLFNRLVGACVVVGAEENDWLTADAFRLFCKQMVLSDGAGALYLRADRPAAARAVELGAVSDSNLFTPSQDRGAAAAHVRNELPSCDGTVLVDGLQGLSRVDAAEEQAWRNWPGRRISPKRIVGEGLTAATAWNCVMAVRAVRDGAPAANVSVVGTNQQAIGARFVVA